jgi:hypothetical protein
MIKDADDYIKDVAILGKTATWVNETHDKRHANALRGMVT